MTAFFNPYWGPEEEENRPFRVVLDQSMFHLADGQLKLWGRTSEHGAGSMSSQLIGEFEQISLNELVQTTAPSAEAMPGRLAGSFRLAGDPRRSSRCSASPGPLTESDLANFDPIALLYNLLNVGVAGRQPNGQGTISARLEASTVRIESVLLLQPGHRHPGHRPDPADLGHARFAAGGNGRGLAQPLKNLKLPGISDVSDLLGALQGNLTTVRVDGTLREPAARPVVLSEIRGAMQELLLGEVRDKK